MNNIAEKQKLTPEEMQILQSEMENKKKNPIVAWLLWVFLGCLGGHHFYLGNTKRGLIFILLFFLGYATLVILIGIIFLLILGIWWIVDAFKMNARLEEFNNELERDIIAKIKYTRTV